MCVALTMIGEEEDFHDQLEADADFSHGKNEIQMRFSYQQFAWVMIKPSRVGHIVKINCGGKSQRYLSRKGGIQHSRYKMVHPQNMNVVQTLNIKPKLYIFSCETAAQQVHLCSALLSVYPSLQELLTAYDTL